MSTSKNYTVNHLHADYVHIEKAASNPNEVVNYETMVAYEAGEPADGVTSVTAGTGLTASTNPIVATGTISLADTAVTPGATTSTAYTVDAQGRLTSATNGDFPKMVTFGANLHNRITSTRYLAYGNQSSGTGFTQSSTGLILPFDATLTAIYVEAAAVPPGLGQTYTLSVEDGGVPVATAAISDTDLTGSSTGLAVAFSAGAIINCQLIYSPGADASLQIFQAQLLFST